MKKIIILLMMFFLLLPLVKSDVIRTTTGFIWTNITFDNRTLIDWDFYVYNDSFPLAQGSSAVISNFERKDMFLVLKIIPTPNDACFTNYQNCPTTGFNTKINVSYSRPATHLSLYFIGTTKYTSNWGADSVDVVTCWNWWNTTDYDKRMAQQRNCPEIAIKVDNQAEGCNIFFTTSAPGQAQPNYIARLQGFSVNYVDVDTKISPTVLRFVTTILDFQDVILDIWRVAYYTYAVIMILFGLILIIGVLPLGLKWVIKKISGD